ncbi:MAG: carbohydrate porin, partial [Caulobacteraceae bacterium]
MRHLPVALKTHHLALLSFAAASVLSSAALAQERAATPPETTPAASAQPTPPSPQSGPLADWAAWKAGLDKQGIDFALSYRSEDLSAVSGVPSRTPVHAGQLSLVSQFDMDKLVGWQGAAITASFSYRDGDTINTARNVDALLGPQEIYGRGHDFRMSQFWLDQKLFKDRIELRIGRLSPGEDFQATECSFTNLSFCANQPGNHVADVWYTWPISQWGAAVKFNFDATKYFKVGAYQVNPRNLESNFFTVLSPDGGTGALTPFEFGWTPKWADGRIGEYKLGGWYSSAPRSDLYLDVDRNPAALTGLGFLQRSGSYGAFASIVQQLTRGDASNAKSGLRLVVKGSLADRATSTVDQTFATTLVYTGPIKVRPNDDVGVAD